MKLKLFIIGCGMVAGLNGVASAATTSGTINATLTLTPGCLINGGGATTGVNFGTLDFGSSPASFDSLNATLAGNQGNGIFVKCTTDASYHVQVASSNLKPATVYAKESDQARYLLLTTDDTKGVAYTLYSDAAHSTPIANNSDLPKNGTPDPTNGDNYPIYGRIDGGNFNLGIPPGTYKDTINVVVIY